MTAFHITVIAIILFLIIFFILIYREGLPHGYDEWIAAIALSVVTELVIIIIGSLIGAVIYALWHVDWYGFFHDKLF